MASFSTSSIPPLDNMSSFDLFSTKTNLPEISIKLASTNYLLWKAQVVLVLQGHGLLSYVTNEVHYPPTTILSENGVWNPNSTVATWLRLDQLILRWINISLSDIPFSQVINCEMTRDALKTLYDRHTRDRVQQMRGELQALTKGSSCMEEYLHRAKALVLSLCGARKPMEDEDFIICLLRGLRPEFDLLVAAINARDIFPPLGNVISKLRDFDLRISSSRDSANFVVALNTTRTYCSKPRGASTISCSWSHFPECGQHYCARGGGKPHDRPYVGHGQQPQTRGSSSRGFARGGQVTHHLFLVQWSGS